MRKKNLQDERIVAERRKIQSDAFGIIFVILGVSAMVQQFLFEATVQQYIVELVCFIGMAFYLIIRNIMVGNDLFDNGKRGKSMLVINSLVVGIIATVIHGVLNYTRHTEHYANHVGLFIASLAIFFISVTLLSFVSLFCFYQSNKKRQMKIQKQLDIEEGVKTL